MAPEPTGTTADWDCDAAEDGWGSMLKVSFPRNVRAEGL
jgi:hypothetical protein